MKASFITKPTFTVKDMHTAECVESSTCNNEIHITTCHDYKIGMDDVLVQDNYHV